MSAGVTHLLSNIIQDSKSIINPRGKSLTLQLLKWFQEKISSICFIKCSYIMLFIIDSLLHITQ